MIQQPCKSLPEALGLGLFLLLFGSAAILRSGFISTICVFDLHLLLFSLHSTGPSRSRSGGVTAGYLDCLRVLDLEVLLDGFEPSLTVVFAAVSNYTT